MLFVGRKGPLSQAKHWFLDSSAQKVQIASIYGPGGIGKTYMLEYCLHSASNSAREENLIIHLNGRKTPKSLPQILLNDLPEQNNLEPSLKRNAFRHLRKRKKLLYSLFTKAQNEVQKAYGDTPELKKLMEVVLTFGLTPDQALAFQPYDLELAKVDRTTLEKACECIQNLNVFKMEPNWLPFFLGGRNAKAIRNRLRKDATYELSLSLYKDLCAIFREKKRSINAPYFSQRIDGTQENQLFFVIDDYESMSHLLGSFLIDCFIPLLEQASFTTFLIIVGRDNLLATHIAWGQHYRRFIGDRLIELKPFQQQEAFEFMRRRGIHQQTQLERIWKKTQGYPFLLDLECQDEIDGGQSALGLKVFFDRLTRWMTPIQREWIVPLAFLDEINLETVKAILPNNDPQSILDWFKMEPSIRDPHSNQWQVFPFVKKRIQEYVKVDSPNAFAKLVDSANHISDCLNMSSSSETQAGYEAHAL